MIFNRKIRESKVNREIKKKTSNLCLKNSLVNITRRTIYDEEFDPGSG